MKVTIWIVSNKSELLVIASDYHSTIFQNIKYIHFNYDFIVFFWMHICWCHLRLHLSLCSWDTRDFNPTIDIHRRTWSLYNISSFLTCQVYSSSDCIHIHLYQFIYVFTNVYLYSYYINFTSDWIKPMTFYEIFCLFHW